MHNLKIVVPFYNVEKWIKQCIESIKSQNYKNFSCVVIDDVSTDDSYEKCISAVGDDKRFVVVKNEEKKYALKNIVDGINLLNPNEKPKKTYVEKINIYGNGKQIRNWIHVEDHNEGVIKIIKKGKKYKKLPNNILFGKHKKICF